MLTPKSLCSAHAHPAPSNLILFLSIPPFPAYPTQSAPHLRTFPSVGTLQITLLICSYV